MVTQGAEVLVLNCAYQPINRASWQDVMVKWTSGGGDNPRTLAEHNQGVNILEVYEDRLIHPKREIYMPSVVALREPYSLDYKGIKFSRYAVFARDKGRCQYCGVKVRFDDFEFEHVVPRAQGGKTNFTNIVTSCTKCNQRKGGRTPEQARMRLRNGPPVKPKSLPPKVNKKLVWHPGMPEVWKKYGMPTRDQIASYMYWGAELDND